MSQLAIEIFKPEDGTTGINVIFGNDTAWLKLNQISALFKRDKSLTSRHIPNIF